MKRASNIMIISTLALVLGGCSVADTLGEAAKKATGSLTEKKGEPFSGTLEGAMALGVPMKCTTTLEDGTTTEAFIKGENYVANTVTAEGEKGSVLMKDDCMYTWNEGVSEGVEMCFDDEEMMEEEDVEDMEYEDEFDVEESEFDETTQVDCVPAVFGSEKFALPEGVKFANFDEMMNGAFMELGEQMQQGMEEGMSFDKDELESMEQEAQDLLQEMEDKMPKMYQ